MYPALPHGVPEAQGVTLLECTASLGAQVERIRMRLRFETQGERLVAAALTARWIDEILAKTERGIKARFTPNGHVCSVIPE